MFPRNMLMAGDPPGALRSVDNPKVVGEWLSEWAYYAKNNGLSVSYILSTLDESASKEFKRRWINERTFAISDAKGKDEAWLNVCRLPPMDWAEKHIRPLFQTTTSTLAKNLTIKVVDNIPELHAYLREFNLALQREETVAILGVRKAIEYLHTAVRELTGTKKYEGHALSRLRREAKSETDLEAWQDVYKDVFLEHPEQIMACYREAHPGKKVDKVDRQSSKKRPSPPSKTTESEQKSKRKTGGCFRCNDRGHSFTDCK